jgi:hypothetical protein
MTDEQTKRVFEILAESGQIEHHKAPLFSDNFKTLLCGLLLGFFCGFCWGIIVMASF